MFDILSRPDRRRLVAVVVFGVCATSVVGTTRAAEPSVWVRDHLDELVQLYRHFHQNPEVSLQESVTADRVSSELKAVGCKVGQRLGGHGVVAVLENGPGPRLMLRADMDALPVTEQTGLVYASQVKIKDQQGRETGVMHACGHDIHMTSLIGVARYLAAHKQAWQGTLVCIGQPAEEVGSGAQAMLDDGLFTKYPRPDRALALHCSALLPTGSVGYRAGPALANVDSVDITVYGRGGHGAYPHTTIDPIVQAAQLVVDLQTIVSREMKPIEPAVVTVGSIHGGTKHNIIGDQCQLQLTVRCYKDEVRKQLHAAIARKAKAVAASFGAPDPKVEFKEGANALNNDEQLVARLVPVFERLVGKEQVVATEPSMGGEDFSQFGLAGVPVFQFQVGTVDPLRLAGYKRTGQTPPSLHSPLYYPDAEATLVTAVTTLAGAVLDLLPTANAEAGR